MSKYEFTIYSIEGHLRNLYKQHNLDDSHLYVGDSDNFGDDGSWVWPMYAIDEATGSKAHCCATADTPLHQAEYLFSHLVEVASE